MGEDEASDEVWPVDNMERAHNSPASRSLPDSDGEADEELSAHLSNEELMAKAEEIARLWRDFDESRQYIVRAGHELAHRPPALSGSDIRRACVVAALAADFFELIEKGKVSPSRGGGSINVSPSLASDVVALASAVRSVRGAILAIDEVEGSDADLRAALRRASSAVTTHFDAVLRSYISLVDNQGSAAARTRAVSIANDVGERLAANRLIYETQEARDEAVRVLEDTRQAAGATGSTALARYFGDHAKAERGTADRLRLGVVASLLVILGFAAYFLLGAPPSATSIVSDLARLAVTVPLAVLAGYLGKESSRHRILSNWSRELEIQLLTLGAFTAPLSPEEQQEHRSALGRKVFSSSQPKEARVDTAPNVIADTAALLEKVAGVVRASSDKKS